MSLLFTKGMWSFSSVSALLSSSAPIPTPPGVLRVVEFAVVEEEGPASISSGTRRLEDDDDGADGGSSLYLPCIRIIVDPSSVIVYLLPSGRISVVAVTCDDITMTVPLFRDRYSIRPCAVT